MGYSTILCGILVAHAAVVDAAPGSAKRSKSYDPPHSSPRTTSLPIRPLSERAYHPDPAVQYAYLRDEGINIRAKYAARLDAETYKIHERDCQLLESERLMKRAGNGSATLTNYVWDMMWAIDVQVGTPPQPLLVNFDTGSPDFVVFEHNCKGCDGNHTFDDKASSTIKDLKISSYTEYMTGKASGKWVSDRVEIAGSIIDDQQFILASPSGSENKLSGTMGFAPPSKSMQGPTGPVMDTPAQFYRTAAKNLWAQQEFGIYLKRSLLNATDVIVALGGRPLVPDAGVVTFGGVDETYVNKSDIHYMPTIFNDGDRWWQLPLEGLTANGKPIKVPNPPVVIDSGSTMIYLPLQYAFEVARAIPGARHVEDENGRVAGSFIIPCNTTYTLSFTFGGKTYDMDARDLYRTKMPDGSVPDSGDTTYCYAVFNVGPWLLGGAFMKSVYTSFRIDPPEIGFGSLTALGKQSMDPALLPSPPPTSGVLPASSAAAVYDARIAGALIVAGVVASVLV